MALSIVSLQYLKDALHISGSAFDDSLLVWGEAAEIAVQDYIGFKVAADDITAEFHDGDGTPFIRCRRRPVQGDDLRVWLDPLGYAGEVDGAFAASTELTQGVDFVLVKDSADYLDQSTVADGGTPISMSGMIRRIGPAEADFPYPFSPVGGDLIPRTAGPAWPCGIGNIKVAYSAGFISGNPPASIKMAVSIVAGYWKATAGTDGVVKTGERLGNYSYSGAYIMPAGGIASAPEFHVCRQLLSKYRMHRVVA